MADSAQIVVWGLVLGLPLILFGGAALLFPDAAHRFARRFEASRTAAGVLTVVAWFWTAYECDTIGIDVFDSLLKRFPMQLWIMAVVLSYLTVIWMPRHLSVRAVTALLMLFPAELFPLTKRLLPESGFASVHVIVGFAYLAAIVGMYGMFYPWRLEKALDVIAWGRKREPGRVRGAYRALGAALAATGAAVALAAFFS